MIQVLTRFLTFNVVSEHPMVYWGMGAVWIFLLISAMMSLRALSITTFAKVSWFGLIFLIPIIGLAIYCANCLVKGDWSFLKTLIAQPRIVKSIQNK